MDKPVENKPVDYIDLIDRTYQAKGYPQYAWSRNEDAPLTALRKHLRQSTVGLLTSGGISYKTAEPFEAEAKNNFRLDEIDPYTPNDGFQIHDAYYDIRDGLKDINVVFPLERLRELAEEGEIGKIAKRHWSGFMGRTYKRGYVMQTAAPALTEQLLKDEVDILVLVPA
jgi:D-proline reductase (dithiol) PrdB